MSADASARPAARALAPGRSPSVTGPHTLSRGGRTVELHVCPDAPFVDASATPLEAFDAVWAQLPDSDRTNRIRVLPQRAAFLKGERRSVSWGLRHAFSRRGIAREAAALEALGAAGVPAPRVFMWGVERRLGIPRRTVLVIELIEGGVDLSTLLRGEVGEIPRGDLLRELLVAVGRVVGRMHAAGIHHRDLSARNLVVRPETNEVFVIDCPRAERAGLAPRTAFLRRSDLTRLARTVLRRDVADGDVHAMLDAAGDDRPAETIRHARACLGRGEAFRTRVWNVLGI